MSMIATLCRKSQQFTRNRVFHQTFIMPKNKKQGAAQPKKEQKKAEESAVYSGNKNEIIIKVHAKPGAKESAITDIIEGAVGIQIAAPPMEGEANKELIRYLAEVLQFKKSELSLEKGSRSRDKTIILHNTEATVDSVLNKLSSVSKQKS